MSRILAAAFILLILTIAGLAPSQAQDGKLVDAAKKEGGKVVVYGSLENDTMDLLSAAFKKKTGLEVDYWRDADRKSTRLNSSHIQKSRMPSSA